MIEVRGLSKSFDLDGSSFALQDVSFEAERGAIFGLLGIEGAGKTTTLRILATLIAPGKGAVRVGGYDVVTEPDRVKGAIGYMPENSPVEGGLTVTKQLNLWGSVDGLPRAERRTRVSDLVELVGLAEVADTLVLECKAGQLRELALAQALLSDPDILLADEPMAALSLSEKRAMREVLLGLQKEGKTILLTSANLEDVAPISTDVLLLDLGRPTLSYRIDRFLGAIGEGRQARVFVEADTIPSSTLSALKKLPDVVDLRQTDVALIAFVKPGTDAVAEIEEVLTEGKVEVKRIKVAEIPLTDVFRNLIRRESA
ncbi:MAG: ABC transporter ATP-binding protein [Thermoplasmata archaeon]